MVLSREAMRAALRQEYGRRRATAATPFEKEFWEAMEHSPIDDVRAKLVGVLEAAGGAAQRSLITLLQRRHDALAALGLWDVVQVEQYPGQNYSYVADESLQDDVWAIQSPTPVEVDGPLG